jgi:PAS domain S-box-containing protein
MVYTFVVLFYNFFYFKEQEKFMGWLQLFDDEVDHEKLETENQQKQTTVLVVDDEVSITDTLNKYLSLENYTVFTANNGNEGLEKYWEHKPQIIITDIKMPGMSGLEFLGRIRSEDLETEIIVVTGHGDMDSAIEALKNNASDFLLKPLDLEVILYALQRTEARINLKKKVKSYTVKLEKLLKQVNYSKRHMETIVQNSPSAMLTYDTNGVITSWNAEAEKLTGYSSDESKGKSFKDLFVIESHIIDIKSAADDKQSFQNVICQILTKDHQLRYISRNANVLKDQDNKIIGGIESFLDITEKMKKDSLLEKRYLQVQAINEIGKMVASSHDRGDLTAFICNHLAKTFFESSQITLFLHNSELNKLVLSAMAGYHIERVKESFPIGSLFNTNKGIIGKVFTSGEHQIINDISTCEYFVSGPTTEIVSEFGFTIRSEDRIFGVLNIENTEKMQLDESDMFMLETIAEYLGIAMERIELLEKITNQNELLEKQANDLKKALYKVESQKKVIEDQNEKLIADLKKAGEFQKSLLPVSLPEIEHVKFAASYAPSSQLGGDIYDVFMINDDLTGLIVADASGHGVAAAMLSAMFKMTLQKYASEILNPAQVFDLLNKDFCKVLQMGEFFTAFYAVYDRKTRRLIYSNAGHPRPLLYNYDTSEIIELDTDGFLLGVMDEGITYEKKEIELNGHFRLLIYTDGVNEAIDKDDKEYGTERVTEQLIVRASENPQSYLQNILDDLVKYTGSEAFEDDVTLVAMDLS